MKRKEEHKEDRKEEINQNKEREIMEKYMKGNTTMSSLFQDGQTDDERKP
jgi:hypothetical protein